MASRSSSSKPRLVLATLNPAKARELEALLGEIPFEMIPLSVFEGARLPPEGEWSYLANALGKARATARIAGALALADDSGLEVDALGGQPGVLSSRYGGPGLSDAERCAKLLDALQKAPPERRRARFRCVIALVDPSGIERVVEGVVEGVITPEPRGSSGFGYDPIFLYPPLMRTFAELSPGVKDSVSHRGRAVAEARQILSTWPQTLKPQ
ncbi:MAG: RdgB/HAM1 family non-canonical purine NTP pyrophosphatase [Candidatus Methylomirabilia bacterium]